MKMKRFRRSGMLVIALLGLGFSLVPAAGASAAAKTKTFFIPTVVTNKYSDSDGEKATIKESREITEDGLLLGRSTSDEKGLYDRYEVTKRAGNGSVLKQKVYDDDGLQGTYTYKYYKNGRIKKAVYKPAKGSVPRVQKYNKKGDITFRSYKDGKAVDTYTYKYKYDKKGNPTSIVMTWKTKDGSKKAYTRRTVKTTIKNTYVKKGKNKGKLSKVVSVARSSKYNTQTYKDTTTIKYKYNKKGRLVKQITTSKTKSSDGESWHDKTVSTYTFKKVKVPKKYWKSCKYISNEEFFEQMLIEE